MNFSHGFIEFEWEVFAFRVISDQSNGVKQIVYFSVVSDHYNWLLNIKCGRQLPLCTRSHCGGGGLKLGPEHVLDVL